MTIASNWLHREGYRSDRCFRQRTGRCERPVVSTCSWTRCTSYKTASSKCTVFITQTDRKFLVSVAWRELNSLREAHKKSKDYKRCENRNYMMVTVVLISDPNIPRSIWKAGRIVDLVAGSDSAIRETVVCMARSEQVTNIFCCHWNCKKKLSPR